MHAHLLTKIRRYWVEWLFSIAASCSIAGFLNSTLWLFNLCAQFRLVYVAIGLLGLIYFAVRKNVRFAVLALGFCILNLMPVLPYWSSSGATYSSGTATPLRVLQMNVWVNNKDYSSVVGFIRHQAPDVVALEEYSEELDKHFGELGLWKDYPFHVSANNNYRASQIALLSKIKPDSVQVVPTYLAARDPSILANMRIGGKPVTVVVMHPRPPAVPQLLTRQTNHLNKISSLRNTLAKLVIVAGDLNTTPWAEPFRKFLTEMNLRDTRDGSGPSPSYPTWLPFLPIDYVLCSPQIAVRQFKLLAGNGSDHQSILVDLDI